MCLFELAGEAEERGFVAEAPKEIDADREAVASEFVTHADAVKKGLHEYADLLAAGDPVLRDRLRKLAGGVR